MLADARIEAVFSDGAVRDIALGIDLQDLLLRHGLEKIAKAQHHDLVTHDQNAAAAVVQGDRVERTPEAQDDVTPAFAARRAVIELAQEPTELGLVGLELLDSRAGEAVEDTELLLTQALVDDESMALDTDTPFSLDDLGRALRSEIRRGQNDVGAFSC